MIPGEIRTAEGGITLNAAASVVRIPVVNTGDRPVQVGSHFHFAQANQALRFDRDAAYGRRLGIPAGTAVRFEPGIEREVVLVPIGGARRVPGLTRPAPGALDARDDPDLPDAPAPGAPGAPDAPDPRDAPAPGAPDARDAPDPRDAPAPGAPDAPAARDAR